MSTAMNHDKIKVLASKLAKDAPLEDCKRIYDQMPIFSTSGTDVVVTHQLNVYSDPDMVPYDPRDGSCSDYACKREVYTAGADAKVHGRLSLNLGKQGDIESIDSQSYDFNYGPNGSFWRNVKTFGAGMLHGKGNEYTMHYHKVPTVNQ